MKAKREQILIRTSWISTIGNAILSTSKIIVGLWAGSLAVLGDGIDSATDVIISIVMIFTARIISQPPSKKYVFGYEKAEGIATKNSFACDILCRGANVDIIYRKYLFRRSKRNSVSHCYIRHDLFDYRQTSPGFISVQTREKDR